MNPRTSQEKQMLVGIEPWAVTWSLCWIL